jgi:hypothetical protein
MPTQESRLDRINVCISDLSTNGIHVRGADDQSLNRLVQTHVDYFQLMLGYDSDPEEIIALLKLGDR